MSKYIVIYDWMSAEFGNTAKRDVYALLYMHCKGGKVEYQCPQSYIADRLNLGKWQVTMSIQTLQDDGWLDVKRNQHYGNNTYKIIVKTGVKTQLETSVKTQLETSVKITRPYNDSTIINNTTILNDNIKLGANQVCTPPKKPTITERENEFKQRVYEYQHRYPPNTLNDFIDYWTERNPKGVKMRFEFQKIFDLPRRLATWARKEQEYNFEKNKHNERTGNDRAELAREIYEGLRRGDRRL